jgi:hypothetical protein
MLSWDDYHKEEILDTAAASKAAADQAARQAALEEAELEQAAGLAQHLSKQRN